MPGSQKRKGYSSRTIKLLWGKSGGLCAFPGCPNDLILRSSDDIIGDIAHIVSHSAEWTRGDKDFPVELLDEYDNLILLCRHHHGIVDVRDSVYSVEELKQIKYNHEQKIDKGFRFGKPWKAQIRHLHYVNVPRLSILSGQAGQNISDPYLHEVKSLHELGFGLVRVLVKLEQIVNEITPNAIPLTDFRTFTEVDLCCYCSFSGKFRTRNGPSIEAARAGFTLTEDVKKNPRNLSKNGRLEVYYGV